MPIRQAGPLRNEPQQPELEDCRPDMPRIALHFASNPVRAILASGKIAFFLALIIFAQAADLSAKEHKRGQFDDFVLALSWSPSYCAGDPGQRDAQQCAPGRRFAFVVHGLWPIFVNGWQESCERRKEWIPQERIDAMLDVMPSKKLIIHEWKKHGACSGLTQADYFGSVRKIFGNVRIPARYLSPQAPVTITPEQLVADFVKSNRGLTADMLSVHCGNAKDMARLSELRICVNKTGSFTACEEPGRLRCQAKIIVMPPVK